MSFSRLRNAYENFVCDSSWYVALLDAAKTFSVFLPGRFSQTQISGEVVYTLLTILSHYHDGVLGRPRVHPAEIKTTDEEPMVSKPPSRLESSLNMIMFGLVSTQTLLENLSGHFYRYRHGERFMQQLNELEGRERYRCSMEYEESLRKFRWKCIFAVELVKAVIRLIFLYRHGGRMLLPPSTADTLTEHRQRLASVHLRKLTKELRNLQDEITQLEVKLRSNEDKSNEDSLTSPSTPSNDSNVIAVDTTKVQEARAAEEAEKIKTEARFSELRLRLARLQHTLPLREEYLRHGRGVLPHGEFSAYQQERVHPRETPAYKPTKAQILSEVLYWIRPVVYAYARIIYPDQSWTPIIISAMIDLASRKLAGSQAEMSPAQQQQMLYRKHLYFYYFLRTPIFERFTMIPLYFLVSITKPIPLVGGITETIAELITSIRAYHFLTSAS